LQGDLVPNPPDEIELKFLIAPEKIGDLLAHPLLQGEMSTARLRSVYYDTPELDLRDIGITLRVRWTGNGYVQTVKTLEAGAPRRGEWESPVENEDVDRAALATTPASEILNGKAGSLVPIFSTTVERRSQIAEFENARIEVSFDHGEISSGEASEPIEELELELKAGEISSLFGLARELCRATSIRLWLESKAERGVRLRDGAAADPRKAEPVNLSAAMCSMEAFQEIARACLVQVTANDELLRRIRRPEAIHQLRIGLRRLRTATSIFKIMVADDERETIETELKWLTGELDPARDIDVFGKTTFRHATKANTKTGLAELGRHLRKAKSKACALLEMMAPGIIDS
jgi:triphosphatase